VLLAERRWDEAAARLAAAKDAIPAEEAERLRHELARGLLRAGRLPEAAALVATDSTTEGLGLRGRIRLLQGDLVEAASDLAAAGPYSVDRSEATDRAVILALLQVLDDDSLPALGDAFAALERGDSAAAAAGFERVADALPPERGGAELRLLAGRIEVALGAVSEAEVSLRRAAGASESAAAPAARLELARLLVRTGRSADAVPALEQLILDHPASAVTPQARRLLDTVRGGVPPA
jgi:tetratricopeptide (TPR) repeat protein